MVTYQFSLVIAATLCVLRFALAAAAIGFCISLFRRTHSVGWLFLGVVFIEPFYNLATRFAHGRPLLPYRTMGPGTGGAGGNITIHFDIPMLYVFALVGLLLLARRIRRETQAKPSAE